MWTAVGVAATIWLIVAAKLPALWHGRTDAARRFFLYSLTLLGLCITADRCYRPLGQFLGLPNVGFPLVYGCGMLAAYWCQRFLLAAHLGHVRAPRWRTGVLLAALGVLVAGYLAGPLHRPNDYWITHPLHPDRATLPMYVTIALYACFSLADIGWHCWALSRLAGGTGLRWGLRLTSLGTVLAISRFLLEYLIYATAAAVAPGRAVASWHGVVSETRTVATLGAGLMAVGMALPAIARRLTRIGEWTRRCLTLRRLRWLRARLDDVATALPRLRTGVLPLRTVEAELYRAVIEISDARLALRGYGCGADGAGLDASRVPDFAAARDTVAYQYALARRRHGMPTHECPMWTPAARTYEQEVAHLSRVARAWRAGPTSVDPPPGCDSCQRNVN